MDDNIAPSRENLTRDGAPVARTAQERVAPGRFGRRIVMLCVLIAVGAAGYWAFIMPRGASRSRTASVPPQAVRDAEVAKRDIAIVLNALGTVSPLGTVTVRTQISGQLQSLGFQEGQMVHKGDFLAQVDPRPYEVALEQAQGQQAKDQALLEQAQSDLNRYQTLARQDSIARQQADNQVFLVRQYQSALISDQSQIDSAKLNIAYCHIVAPLDGRIGLRQVDVGNYVQNSDAGGIVVITQIQPISVLFSIPEDNLPAVTKRLRAGAVLPVEVYDRANVTKLAEGQLLTTDNQVDATTGSVKLRAIFPNQDDTLFPQQFVNVRLKVDTLTDQVAVPLAAIQRGSMGSMVYLLRPDSTVTARPVTLGPQEGDFVSVTSGLALGDHVVVDGVDRLREGAPVAVRNPVDAARGAAETAAPPAGERRRQRRPDQQ